jgi:hypothetical protein
MTVDPQRTFATDRYLARARLVQSPNAAPAASLLRRLNLRPHSVMAFDAPSLKASQLQTELRHLLGKALQELPREVDLVLVIETRARSPTLTRTPARGRGLCTNRTERPARNTRASMHFGRSGSAERADEGRHGRRATTRHVIVAGCGQEEHIVHPFADPGRA